jgi:sterol desaturase/sphingolipid hydroxylase (fatty acid hydroxylase superfamily)
MIFALKLVGYFLLWGLWSYGMHALAHSRWRRWNFIRYCHLKHHQYDYGGSMWPPWHDYLFWFGNWRSSMDVYLTFTVPLIGLAFYDPVYGGILLAFHYIYEVFLSRNVLDHNPNIRGPITKFIPIGEYHVRHHRNVRCNFAFYLTVWDHLFGTYASASSVQQKKQLRRAASPERSELEQAERSAP